MNAYILALVAAFGIQLIFFLFAATLKTDKVTDLSYGLSFVAIVWIVLLLQPAIGLMQFIVALLVTLWGLRLAGYLFIRILHMKTDKRFDGIRENFGTFARFWLLQAIAVWVILLPVLHLLQQSWLPEIWLWIGGIVWLLGFVWESVADYQKFVFRKKQEGVIMTGLYRYSRFPNYFGEILLWWGLFVVALPTLSDWAWLVVAGPLFITGLLLFGTGIPTVEKRYEGRYGKDKAYRAYVKRTSKLIPWLPKSR